MNATVAASGELKEVDNMKEIGAMSNAEMVNAIKNDIGQFDERQLENILEVFPYKNWEATSFEIVSNLSKNGHANPGEILRHAFLENVLMVSSIENDGIVYFELGFNGEVLWNDMSNKRKRKMWDTAYML